MRSVLTLLLVVLIGYSASAIPSNLSYLNKETNLRLSENEDIAYHVVIDDGQNSKVYDVPRLDETLYLPNAIIIKTRGTESMHESRRGFYNANLQNSLSLLNPTKIVSLTEGVVMQSPKKKDNLTLAARENSLKRIYTVYYDSHLDPYEACKEMMMNSDIEYAEPIYRRDFHYTPNDPDFNKQWGVSKINAVQAWDKSRGSEEVVVAVIDSGTDIFHEDLAANMWTNPHEIPDDGIDNDENGKIDDVNGWDMVGNISTNQYYMGQFQEDNNPANNSNTHGTNVAGCVSGVADNGKGIAGIGYKVKIWPIKCASEQISQGILRGYHAILYASSFEEIKIINCSWGGPGFSITEEDIINTAFERGCLVVTSAGNDGMNVDNGGAYPACYKNCFSIGMTRSNDKAYVMSNWGYLVDVYAPGVSVYTTEAGNRYKKATGTSFSSPMTAGIAALLLSYRPDYTHKQLWHQIRSSSDNVVNPDDRGRYYGRANAYNALNENKLPGIEAISAKLIGESSLTDYSEYELEVTVTNYLFNANNVVVDLESQGEFLDLSETNLKLGSINTDDEITFKLDVRLLANNPWYVGNANIILKFSSPGYVNYQQISIPIEIATSNSQRNVLALNDYQKPQWTQAHSPDIKTLWACGRYGMLGSQGVVFVYDNGSSDLKGVSSWPVYSIFGFDNTNAIALASGNNNAAIYKTVNGGNAWTPTDLSAFTPFLNNVHFWENSKGIGDSKGVAVGDPNGTTWGIFTSDNGGDSWEHVSAPKALTDENNMPQSFAVFGTNVWFGTTKGRVFRSQSNGNTWTVSEIEDAREVYYLAFNSTSTGLAIYKDDNTGEIKLAYTSNGKDWKSDRFNFTERIIEPIGLYAPLESQEIYYHTAHGELIGSSNFGKDWKSILSRYISSVKVSAMAQHEDEFRARLWNLDQEIGYFDFSYRPLNADDRIQTVGDNPVDFGDVKQGSKRNKKLEIENVGNVIVNLLSYEFDPGDGSDPETFSFFGSAPTFVAPDESETFFVRYEATRMGEQKGKLLVTTDGSPSTLVFDLKGNGISSEVKEIQFVKSGPIDFDSVNVGESKSVAIEVQNSGNTDVTASNFEIDGDNPGLFSIEESFTLLPDGGRDTVLVRFTPTSIGGKTAILTITSDADPDKINIDLNGVGTEPSSVEDVADSDFGIISISPNPVMQNATVEFRVPRGTATSLWIADLSGNRVREINISKSYSQAEFSIDELSSGSYYMVLESGGKLTMKKFIISK
jgi:hypothetical protein